MAPSGMIGLRIFWTQGVLEKSIGESPKGESGYSLEIGHREYSIL